MLAVKHGKMQHFTVEPAHLDSLGSLAYMAIVSSLASAAFSRQCSQRRGKKQEAKRRPDTSWSSLRYGILQHVHCFCVEHFQQNSKVATLRYQYRATTTKDICCLHLVLMCAGDVMLAEAWQAIVGIHLVHCHLVRKIC